MGIDSQGVLDHIDGESQAYLEQLEAYLRVAPGADDVGRVEEMVKELRAGRDIEVDGLL